MQFTGEKISRNAIVMRKIRVFIEFYIAWSEGHECQRQLAAQRGMNMLCTVIEGICIYPENAYIYSPSLAPHFLKGGPACVCLYVLKVSHTAAAAAGTLFPSIFEPSAWHPPPTLIRNLFPSQLELTEWLVLFECLFCVCKWVWCVWWVWHENAIRWMGPLELVLMATSRMSNMLFIYNQYRRTSGQKKKKSEEEGNTQHTTHNAGP